MKETGQTMVEMLGVLAIIGVLATGGFTGVRFMMDFYQSNKVALDIEETANRAQDLANISSDLLDPKLLAAGDLCDEGIYAQGCTDGTPNPPFWGGAVSITVGNDGAFSIQYTAVPERMCNRLRDLLQDSFDITPTKCTGTTTMTFIP